MAHNENKTNLLYTYVYFNQSSYSFSHFQHNKPKNLLISFFKHYQIISNIVFIVEKAAILIKV